MLSALTRAGIFRRVLRPDRLLIAELMLFGGVRQVPEALWFRRESNGASVDRQRHSLVLAGDEPKWFHTPPWFQHSVVLWEEYARPEPPPLPISRTAWRRMLLRYQLTYGWKHFRKTEASHAVGRGIDNVIWTKKITKHYWHHAVYNTLVGARAAWGRTRRFARRCVYEVLMLTHRLGLRGRGKAPTPVSLIARRWTPSDARCTVSSILSTSRNRRRWSGSRERSPLERRQSASSSSACSKQLEGLSERLSRLALDRDVRGLHRDIVELRYAARAPAQDALAGAEVRGVAGGAPRRGAAHQSGASPALARERSDRCSWVHGPAKSGSSCSTGFRSSRGRSSRRRLRPSASSSCPRGGPASWYAHIGGRYVDVLSHVTPDEFRSRTEQRRRSSGRWGRSIARSCGA